MEISELALAAYTFSKPFIDKTGEGVARKVGEDIWLVIKKIFSKKDEMPIEEMALTNQEEFRSRLEIELANQPDLLLELQKIIKTTQLETEKNFQQNVNSYDKVEKQINIQNNSGNISM